METIENCRSSRPPLTGRSISRCRCARRCQAQRLAAEFIKAVDAELSTEDVPGCAAICASSVRRGASLAHPYEQQFDFYSTTLRGVPAMPPRWKTCTAPSIAPGRALGQEFVRRTFSAGHKAKTQLMTEQIETAMQHEIENLPWMSDATKAEALRKLHAIATRSATPASGATTPR